MRWLRRIAMWGSVCAAMHRLPMVRVPSPLPCVLPFPPPLTASHVFLPGLPAPKLAALMERFDAVLHSGTVCMGGTMRGCIARAHTHTHFTCARRCLLPLPRLGLLRRMMATQHRVAVPHLRVGGHR